MDAGPRDVRTPRAFLVDEVIRVMKSSFFRCFQPVRIIHNTDVRRDRIGCKQATEAAVKKAGLPMLCPGAGWER